MHGFGPDGLMSGQDATKPRGLAVGEKPRRLFWRTWERPCWSTLGVRRTDRDQDIVADLHALEAVRLETCRRLCVVVAE